MYRGVYFRSCNVSYQINEIIKRKSEKNRIFKKGHDMKTIQSHTQQPQGEGQSCPVRPAFRQKQAEIRQRMQVGTFAIRDRALAEELCTVIAEVYTLAENTDGFLRIEGTPIPYGLVRDIYEFLTPEHLEHVIRRYRSVIIPIRNPKAYLRTALYNAVFELEHSGENEFLSDGGSGR